MRGGPGTFLIACLTMTVALAGCSAVAQDVHMEAPDWKPGYAWSHATQYEYEATWEEDGEKGNDTGSWEGRTIREVVNTTLVMDDEPLYVLIKQQLDDEGDFWGDLTVLRQRDLAEIPAWFSYTSQCINFDCTTSISELDGDASEDAAPTLLDFPLTKDKSWKTVIGGCDDEDEEDLDYECIRVGFTGRVDGAAVVDTPLGPVKAARITTEYKLLDKAAYRDMVLGWAEEDGYQIDSYEFDFSYREVLYYSDNYQAIVRADGIEREYESVRGTDPDGEPFSFSGDERATVTTVLDGARLVARPERSPGDVAAFLGDEPLRDPAGGAVAAAGYVLSVSPADAVVNAADGGRINFTATPDGVDALPDGHRLTWRLVKDGAVMDEQAGGLRFEARATDPGFYSVEVEAREDDAVVTGAGASLVANWQERSTIDCGPYGLSDACPERELPVYPGAKSFHLQVTPTGPLGDTLPGSLTVYDNLGQGIRGERGGGSYTVDIDDLAGMANDADPWAMDFFRGVHALSEVELQLDILYADPEPSIEVDVDVEPLGKPDFAWASRLRVA